MENVFPPLARKSDLWTNPKLSRNRWKHCPVCNSNNTFKNGFYKSRSGIKQSRKYTCKVCDNRWKIPI